ncbi:MAG: UDP-N-acetylglucosamine-1-phosphate transferase, partial [Thermoplasmata archaeon]
IILLAPMILHFLLAMYWVNFKRSKYEHKKFGDVRKDGTISAPHPYYLSWVFPYYFKLREEQITLITMILSAVCGIIAVMLA